MKAAYESPFFLLSHNLFLKERESPSETLSQTAASLTTSSHPQSNFQEDTEMFLFPVCAFLKPHFKSHKMEMIQTMKINFSSTLSHRYLTHIMLLLAVFPWCGGCTVPVHASGAHNVLCPAGGLEHHWDCVGHEQVHRLSPAASADPLCRSFCRHRALHTANWLHAADHLPVVQRPLAHQSPKGCHRGVPAGHLQVRLCSRQLSKTWTVVSGFRQPILNGFVHQNTQAAVTKGD